MGFGKSTLRYDKAACNQTGAFIATGSDLCGFCLFYPLAVASKGFSDYLLLIKKDAYCGSNSAVECQLPKSRSDETCKASISSR
jgi:hypothetical protein